MVEISVVIDTNVLHGIKKLLIQLKEKTGKSYKELWGTFNDDFIKDNLTNEDQKRLRAVINSMKRLIEMKNSSKKYVIQIPSFVYNEAGRGISSKMNNDAKENERNLQIFKDIVDSLPVKTTVDETILKEGIDYPKKSKTSGINIETTMKDFLRNNKQATLIQLIEHLRNAGETKKRAVQERTQMIKNRMTDVLYKNQKWDQPMSEASKFLDFLYETRTKALSSLYGSINKYRDVHKIPFQPDPLDVITERLTMIDEEFDFFDLQIYLYAKEKNAPIMTSNTQAYQEINDPCFLGYFEDIKIMHPLINFDSLQDLNKSGDLNEIIDRSIKKDFNEVDLPICRELDKRLTKPILENKGGELIKTAESSYSPKVKRLQIDMSLGSVLKVLRIEHKKLKVSREFFFEEYNIKTLQFIDKQFFNNQLSSNDFVKDNVVIEKSRKYFLKFKTLANYLDKTPEVKRKLEQFQANPGTYLDEFLTKFRGKSDMEVRNLFLALSIETHFSQSEIQEGLHKVPHREALSPKTGARKKREAEKQSIVKARTLEEWYNAFDKISTNIIGDLPRRSKRDLSAPQDSSNRSGFKPTQLSARGIFGTDIQSLGNIYKKSLDYVQDYFKYPVNPTPKLVLNPSQHPKVDFPKEHRIANERILGSEPNINEGKITYKDVNSTLLLLGTLIRKLNDSKYKLPMEDYLLSPPEQVEKKMLELSTKLGLDADDIVASIEKQQQRILDNLAED